MAYLQQHVLLLGNHVHVVLKVMTAKVDGLNQYLLIAIYLSQRGRKGGRERSREEREKITVERCILFCLHLTHHKITKQPYHMMQADNKLILHEACRKRGHQLAG